MFRVQRLVKRGCTSRIRRIADPENVLTTRISAGRRASREAAEEWAKGTGRTIVMESPVRIQSRTRPRYRRGASVRGRARRPSGGGRSGDVTNDRAEISDPPEKGLVIW
jgi:hypothetical protein